MDNRLTDKGARMGDTFKLPSTGETYVYVGGGYFMEESDFDADGGIAYKASELVEEGELLTHTGNVEEWAINKLKGNA